MPKIRSTDHIALNWQAHQAYRAGFSTCAAELFRRAADAALEHHDLTAHVRNLRWTGNAFIWANQHDDASPHLLRAISFEGEAGASVEDIYGAMTDLCLLAVRSRPDAMIQWILADTREFLRRRGLEPWGHRVDLLQAMRHLRRGEFADAHQLASRAWQMVHAGVDGPHYQNGAYLNIVFRAAHGLGDVPAMDDALTLFRQHSESNVVVAQLRHKVAQGIRVAFDGISEDNREAIRFLAEEVLGTMATTEHVRDESLDALRLLALAGQSERAAELHDATGLADGADAALVRLDIELCRLTRATGWQPPLYISRPLSPTFLPPLLMRDEGQNTKVRALLNHASSLAILEDARLNGQLNSDRVTQRRQWLESDRAALMPGTLVAGGSNGDPERSGSSSEPTLRSHPRAKSERN